MYLKRLRMVTYLYGESAMLIGYNRKDNKKHVKRAAVTWGWACGQFLTELIVRLAPELEGKRALDVMLAFEISLTEQTDPGWYMTTLEGVETPPRMETRAQYYIKGVNQFIACKRGLTSMFSNQLEGKLPSVFWFRIRSYLPHYMKFMPKRPVNGTYNIDFMRINEKRFTTIKYPEVENVSR